MATVKINEKKANNNFISTGKTDGSGHTIYRVPNPNEACALDATALTSSDTGVIEPCKDFKTIIVAKNAGGADKKITFKAGNTYAAAGDLDVTVPAGDEVFISVDSAPFADKGTGNIEVTTDAASNMTIAVLSVR